MPTIQMIFSVVNVFQLLELSVCFPVHWRKGNLSTKAGIKFVVGSKSLKFAGGFPRIFYELHLRGTLHIGN